MPSSVNLDRFTTRPKGVTWMIQYSVAALVKDMPFTTDCALSWIIQVTLNPSNQRLNEMAIRLGESSIRF